MVVEYKIQFIGTDILRRLNEITCLNGIDRHIEIEYFNHELSSEIKSAMEIISMSSQLEDGTDLKKIDKQNRTEYFGCVQRLGKIITDSINQFKEYCIDPETVRVGNHTQKFINSLEVLLKYVIPFDEKMKNEKFGKLSMMDELIIETINPYFAMALDTYNGEFSQNYVKSKYDLKKDIMRHYNQYKEIVSKQTNPIIVHEPQFISKTIYTRTDFYRKVFNVLVKNIPAHAFGESRLCFGNSTTESKKEIYLLEVLSENAEDVTMGVADTGVGIPLEIKDKLFKERITKEYNRMNEHGAGLLAVGEFMNNIGGKIWFEDNWTVKETDSTGITAEVEKQGTIFYFKIPKEQIIDEK